ncbi:hypothetical protein COLO4_35413 [Corchorus olitorius]|uniref:RRM domain-containing protein n=1 Tax=Corchorus olitorius TaxID=93759 RepID=A0A1R3GH07_9ROSI|nr:hypothetical protein COLO4_35413 [Corchorus olitorius]
MSRGRRKHWRSSRSRDPRRRDYFRSDKRLVGDRVEKTKRNLVDWRSYLFSVFVDNFEKGTSVASLWNVFGRFGRVVNVYIPKAVKFNSRRRSEYAFVRPNGNRYR